MKFVTVRCDNCNKDFIKDKYWTPDFEMDTGRDECPHCTILHGKNPWKNAGGMF